jgi:hypothetical protein
LHAVRVRSATACDVKPFRVAPNTILL